MAILLSLERYIPQFRYDQEVVTDWARRWLEGPPAPGPPERPARVRPSAILSAYSSAAVRTRASVVPIEEVFHPGDFETQNRKYREIACRAGADVARRALESASVEPSEIRMVVSVSCTGYMIPALDAYVANALGLGPRLSRLPITESGCGGGVSGLARAADYLAAHPDHALLFVALELASLTFQPWDRSAGNAIGVSFFGDGGVAAVLVGAAHPRAGDGLVRVRDSDSVFFRDTTHLMGFVLRNQGFQMLLDKSLPDLARREMGPAVDGFLAARGLSRADVARYVFHPGGRKVVEAFAEALGLGAADVAASECVLAEHGNMGSVTVLYVLDETIRRSPPKAGSLGVMATLGPGFCAELALLEFG